MDNEHYSGRHQKAGEESAEAAEDAFFHDFEVGQQVLDNLNSDLERLHQTVDEKLLTVMQPLWRRRVRRGSGRRKHCRGSLFPRAIHRARCHPRSWS